MSASDIFGQTRSKKQKLIFLVELEPRTSTDEPFNVTTETNTRKLNFDNLVFEHFDLVTQKQSKSFVREDIFDVVFVHFRSGIDPSNIN